VTVEAHIRLPGRRGKVHEHAARGVKAVVPIELDQPAAPDDSRLCRSTRVRLWLAGSKRQSRAPGEPLLILVSSPADGTPHGAKHNEDQPDDHELRVGTARPEIAEQVRGSGV